MADSDDDLFRRKVIRVPKDDAEWFEETYPQNGAWTWFVQKSLQKFREVHETTPDELMELAAEEMHTIAED